jgi:hypothetical protein
MRCPKLSAVRYYEAYSCLQLLTMPACCIVPHGSVIAVDVAAVTCSTCANNCSFCCRCCIVFGYHGAAPQGKGGPGSAGCCSSRSSSSHQGGSRCGVVLVHSPILQPGISAPLGRQLWLLARGMHLGAAGSCRMLLGLHSAACQPVCTFSTGCHAAECNIEQLLHLVCSQCHCVAAPPQPAVMCSHILAQLSCKVDLSSLSSAYRDNEPGIMCNGDHDVLCHTARG